MSERPSTPIRATGLEKAYGDVTALRGVDLAVGGGEVLALVGPNGAGKTTLIRCLTGTVTPDAGEASLLGTDPASADRQRIGLLPQSFSPPARLTAPELVRYYAGLYDSALDPETVLETVGLDDASASTWYERLSGGQQRRACVAAAIVNDPDVLFLDEPTTGIDPEGRRAVWTVLESLVGSGTTILLTTHDMGEAARLADRVAVQVDGRLAAVDSPDALIERHGGGRSLRVTPSDDIGGVDLEGISPTPRIEDGELVVECGADAVADVLRDLDAAGVGFESIEWHEPSLDDVYVELAGSERRPEGMRP